MDAQTRAALQGRDLIVFDGVCVLCSGFFKFMLRHDRQERFSFAMAQADFGQACYAALGMPLDDFQSKINILLHLQIKNNREHVCTILYPCKPEIQEHCCIFGYLWPMILVAFTQTWFHMVPYRNAPLFSHISIPVTSLDLSVWVGYVWIRQIQI